MLWMVPAFWLVMPPFLLAVAGLIFRAGYLRGADEITLAFVLYSPPVVGIVSLISLILVRVFGSQRLRGINTRRTLGLACLNIASPIWLFIEWLFIIGFAR